MAVSDLKFDFRIYCLLPAQTGRLGDQSIRRSLHDGRNIYQAEVSDRHARAAQGRAFEVVSYVAAPPPSYLTGGEQTDVLVYGL